MEQKNTGQLGLISDNALQCISKMRVLLDDSTDIDDLDVDETEEDDAWEKEINDLMTMYGTHSKGPVPAIVQYAFSAVLSMLADKSVSFEVSEVMLMMRQFRMAYSAGWEAATEDGLN
jgi:hypothetical protein